MRETLGKVYRQANNHHASDFKDSELILQDFIDRYVDPSAKSPMKKFTTEVVLWLMMIIVKIYSQFIFYFMPKRINTKI